MQISFDCPKCLKSAQCEVTESSHAIQCPECNWNRPLAEGDLQDQVPCHCLACGCTDLWRQKDFSQRLGVSIVALGILLSTIAMAYMQPELSLGILMVFALADMVLYVVMRDCLVCYRCHARYRRIPNLGQVGTFDLEVNERYRQEAIRLKQTQQSAGSR
ncbi:MAG: hypothetical protein JSS49_23110 [Planctomycetes bacterium]|nr:hypothetical protein [Planctomycetota bacterium]